MHVTMLFFYSIHHNDAKATREAAKEGGFRRDRSPPRSHLADDRVVKKVV